MACIDSEGIASPQTRARLDTTTTWIRPALGPIIRRHRHDFLVSQLTGDALWEVRAVWLDGSADGEHRSGQEFRLDPGLTEPIQLTPDANMPGSSSRRAFRREHKTRGYGVGAGPPTSAHPLQLQRYIVH